MRVSLAVALSSAVCVGALFVGCDDDGGGGGGVLTLYVVVDDSANQTYADGQLLWKGSLAYEAATNRISYDGAWTGPYVPLYDDGPISTGGHEAEGQTAGDHILSVEVVFAPAVDRTIEYGITDDNDTWVWTGASNGSVSVLAGQIGRVEATGMTIAAHGTIDLLLSLDTSALHADFLPFTGGTQVDVKHDHLAWNVTQMLDDGAAPDQTAGNGVYWYKLSLDLGAHDGLLHSGDEVEFVFQIGGSEYKSAGFAVSDGVSAFYNDGGSDQPLAITVDATSTNTQVTIP